MWKSVILSIEETLSALNNKSPIKANVMFEKMVKCNQTLTCHWVLRTLMLFSLSSYRWRKLQLGRQPRKWRCPLGLLLESVLPIKLNFAMKMNKCIEKYIIRKRSYLGLQHINITEIFVCFWFEQITKHNKLWGSVTIYRIKMRFKKKNI